MRSSGRTHPRTVSTSRRTSSSPAAWPKLSFTRFRLSMSIIIAVPKRAPTASSPTPSS
jgi:hypothetical protein